MAQSISNLLPDGSAKLDLFKIRNPSIASTKSLASKIVNNTQTPALAQSSSPNKVYPPTPVSNTGGGYIAPPVMTTTPTNTSIKGMVGPTIPNTTYTDLVGRITGASKPTNVQTGLVSTLEDIARGNRDIGNDSRDIANKYAEEIARVGKLGAGAVAGNLSTGSNVVGTGNAAIASQSASARMQALANASQAELQGTAQQLTGQSQASNALDNALTGANTQQGQQISGLGTAAGFAQPVQAPYSNALYNPITGEMVTQGGLGGYAGYNAAEQTMALIQQYPDAGYQYNASLTPQQNLQMAQSAILGSPTYQRGTFGAAGATSYLGGQQLQSAGELTQQSSLIQAQAGGAEANFHLLLNLAKQGGVNQTNVPILNTIKRNVERGTVSSEAVTTFNSVIQSVRAQYASILGGGTPTDATRREAEAQIPNDVSIAALDSISRALAQEANNRIVGYNQQIQGLTNQNQMGGGFGGGGTVTWDNLLDL